MPDNTLTDAQLDEIEARAAAATPGPWAAEAHRVVALTVRNDAGWGAKVVAQGPQPNADVAFIAHARADVPALIAALRESRERERRLSAAATELRRVAIGGATVDDRHQHGLLAAATGHQLYSYMTFADLLEAWVAFCEASDATEHAIRAALSEQEATR